MKEDNILMQKKEYSKARKYESPKAEIIRFDSEDIITAPSGGKETRLPFITGGGLF